MDCSFYVVEKLLRSTGVPDTGFKLRFVGEFNGFGMRFFRICIERILYLVYDRYIGDRGLLRATPTLAFLVFKTLEDCMSGRYWEKDEIGWKRFMEGMISNRLVCLYADHRDLVGEGLVTEKWASQLVIRLLEMTHGQWVYQNIQVHDEVCGTIRTLEKEQIQAEIEEQMELGFDGFVAMDRSLASVSLEDLESSSGDQQEYWVLAVKAARVAKELAEEVAVDTLPD